MKGRSRIGGRSGGFVTLDLTLLVLLVGVGALALRQTDKALPIASELGAEGVETKRTATGCSSVPRLRVGIEPRVWQRSRENPGIRKGDRSRGTAAGPGSTEAEGRAVGPSPGGAEGRVSGWPSGDAVHDGGE